MNDKKIILEVNEVLNQISKAVEAERSTFFLLNSKKNILESIVAQGLRDFSIKIPLGKGIIGHCVASGTEIIENQVEKSELFDDSFDGQTGYTTKSVLCVPVKNKNGEVIGGLQSLNSINNCFTNKDLELLVSFADLVAAIVKNTNLYNNSDIAKENYSKLLDVFAKVTTELEFENLVPIVMLKAAEITNSERSTLYFVDELTGKLKSRYAKGLEGEEIFIDKGIAWLTLKSGLTQISNDPYNHPEFDVTIDKKTGFKTNSILCAPIFNSENGILGIVQVINHKESKYSDKELSILEGFASQVRIAIENSTLFDQVNGMKNYLNILIDNMDNGIITMDSLGTIQTFNKKFLKMFELNNTIINEGVNLIDLDGEIHQILKDCLYPINTAKKFLEYDLEYQLSKTRKITFNLSALPMENKLGNLVGVIGVFQDISKDKRIRANLSRYIPHHLVNEIINKDNLSIMGSKNRRCSILFCDIRNFTAITEKLGAVQVVKLLNSYFDLMVESIHEYHGVLDKFIGDAVMGVFGLPYTNTNDPINAILCALNMIDKLEKLNRSKSLGVKLNIGIGISTGKVISGNIGSDKRYEYTVIGDPVNLASRLEGETKNYDEQILICDNTYTMVADIFECYKIGGVNIKGKEKPENIYAVKSVKNNFQKNIA